MRGALLGVVVVAVLGWPGAAGAGVEIHGHRGGPVAFGGPTTPENTLPAFEQAAAEGFVLEMDVQLSADGRAVVIHDATLDRTTVCSGRVGLRTLAQLGGCPSDVLGSPGSVAGGVVSPATRVPLPSLADVLALARRTGAKLNVEIKNVPTEPGFDPFGRVAGAIGRELAAGGLRPGQLMIQSFWPPDLDTAGRWLPGVPQALLTLGRLNEAGVLYAVARGYEILSPQWPTSALAIDLAHALGRRVVPYTLDTPDAVRAAAAAGVDGLISNDPFMARAALGG